MELDWDDDNIEHIGRHSITPDEVAEALDDPKRKGAPVYSVGDEVRHGRLATTQEGRVLFVVFVSRHGKVRVITARDATDAERRFYRR
jgi:uncharacterized DUF497 family protein